MPGLSRCRRRCETPSARRFAWPDSTAGHPRQMEPWMTRNHRNGGIHRWTNQAELRQLLRPARRFPRLAHHDALRARVGDPQGRHAGTRARGPDNSNKRLPPGCRPPPAAGRRRRRPPSAAGERQRPANANGRRTPTVGERQQAAPASGQQAYDRITATSAERHPKQAQGANQAQVADQGSGHQRGPSHQRGSGHPVGRVRHAVRSPDRRGDEDRPLQVREPGRGRLQVNRDPEVVRGGVDRFSGK